MRIVEALILAASQVQDQLLLGNRQGPRHGASAIAVLHPADRIGPIAAFEALYLTFTQLQQTGGFAYAQPPACCLLNYFSLVGTLSDSSSPSLEGDKVSLQLWGDIILEHLHGSLFPLPSRIFSARIPTQDDASEVVILLTRPKRSALN
jgi:hypothetical protein